MENIETERLILEPLRKEHASKMYDGYCDEKIYEFIESEIPESLIWLERQFEILEKRELLKDDGKRITFFDWAVYSKIDLKYIGRSEFTIYENGDCNVAYVFFSPYWKKGYAFEAMNASFENMKKKEGVKKFIIKCDSLNAASLRMAHKLRFFYIETIYGVNEFKTRVGDDYVFCYNALE